MTPAWQDTSSPDALIGMPPGLEPRLQFGRITEKQIDLISIFAGQARSSAARHLD
jgi:hypothetical protein